MRVPFLRQSLVALVILQFATSLMLAQTRENARGTGVITGRVLIGEKPAVGVLVGLMRAQINTTNEGGTLSKVATDAEGRYRLTSVSAGSFRVSPLAPGYVSSQDNPGYFEQGRVVNLREDETIESLDFTLTRGGVITGKVTDANNKPLIEQQLTLWKLDQNGRKSNWNMTYGGYFMQTDDRGIYRIYGLPEGRYIISAGAGGPGGVPMRMSGVNYKLTYYPDATEESQAKPIEVTPGSEAKDIDIRLTSETLKGHAVAIRVVDAETGMPVAGVNVGYGPAQNDRVNSFRISMADGQGVLRVDGLTPGRYGAMVRGMPSQPSEYFSETTLFEVGESDVEMVEVRAQRGATVAGKAVIEGNTDPALLAQLVTMRLSAYSRPPANSGGPPVQVISAGGSFNRDGSFRVSGLGSGKVQFNVFGMSGPSNFQLLRVELDGVPQKDGVDVIAGQQVNNVRLVFAYGQAVVRGQVQLVGGALPEGVTMSVSARRTDAQSSSGGRSAQVDARGRFTLEGMAAGEYELTLTASPRFAIVIGPDGNPIPSSTPVPGFPRRVTQKIVVPQSGEVPVTLTLSLAAKEQ